MHTITLPRHRSRRLAAATLVLAALLAACGGGSDDATDDTTTPTEATTDAGTDTGTDTSSEGTDGSTDGTDEGSEGSASTVDICAEITQADMEAILPEATFSSVAPNDVIPVPTCEYSIDLGGFEAAVIQIEQSAEDGTYFDGQRELQTDAVDVPGVTDAFAFEDFGTILVKTDSGTYTIIRGVELTTGGSTASADQMAQIAELVAGL